MKNVVENLVKQTREYVESTGAKGLVVGVSGGVDSAVSALLAVRAVGKENVFFVHMPALDSDRPEDLADAQALADVAGIPLFNHPIDGRNLVDMVSDNVGAVNPNFLQANIKARLRMVTLYAYANALNYMVTGTGNHTEHVIGYFTKYGDGATDFEPIADLYKWQVFEVAEELGAPQSILDKAPSAGLWDDQTDEDELGITYENLDKYLAWRENGVDGMGFKIRSPISTKLAQNVEKRIAQNEHKNHTPPVFKVD